MSDFPLGSGANHGCLSPAFGPVGEAQAVAGAGWGGTTGALSANIAYLVPVTVEVGVTITSMAIVVTTQSGNLDVGIYDAAFNKIVSLGSTACPATGVQVLDITDTYLKPGNYYLAYSQDGTTGKVRHNTNFGYMVLNGLGVRRAGTAFPLPATATPVVLANPNVPYVAAFYRATV